MLRLIHTSDVHIGVKFGAFGEKAELQRQSLLEVFAKIIDVTISSRAHILLIAGDLFDSNFPSAQSVNFIRKQLKRLNDEHIYVAILPGTHDCLSKNSIFKREHLAEGLPYIYIFDDQDVTQKESFSRKKQKRDKFEKNKKFSQEISKTYRKIAKEKKWKLVDASQPREQVHKSIMKIFSSKIRS